MDGFRHARRAAREDVTTFGEELAELHFDTLTTVLDDEMRRDYQTALDDYESAKARLAAADAMSDVTTVTATLADGRFALACVLAARDGAARPSRREPCFFNPAHGPAERDLTWAPLDGEPREIPVCFRDYERLTPGAEPDVRLVALGNRRVPWFSSGPMYAAWAQGWYSGIVEQHRFQADRLTMAFVTTVAAGGANNPSTGVVWADPGSWDGGGTLGGHDYSGSWGGGSSGGGDVGGGDAGGGDAGGGF